MNYKKLKTYLPALLVVIPLLAAASFSSANGGFFASVANAGYGGQGENCPDISAMTLTPSSQTVTAGQHIDFNGRGFAHEEDVIVYNDGSQVGTAHADGGGNFTTGSMVMPTTAGTYTYSFVGVNCNTPITSVITVSNSTTNEGNGDEGNGGEASDATVTASSQIIRANTNVDFNGRNFGHEETVNVYMNGNLITTAHADGGGNFSTGSLNVGDTTGNPTYTFVGQTSGATVSVSINVVE